MTAHAEKTVEVRIDDVAIGGEGIARINGKVCFVPYAVPGDRLSIKIIEDKKDFSRGEIVSLLEPSPSRRSAPCPVFGQCGGCLWQNIEIESQENFKSKLVKELLNRKLPHQSFEFLPLVRSPQEFFYRNRITLKFNGKQLGYFGRRSHDFVPIDHCHLADKRINEALPEILKSLQSVKKPHKKGEDVSSVKISLDPSGTVKWALTHEKDLASGFSQVNTLQNEALVNLVKDWIHIPASKVFYDFYAGSGNFTFPIDVAKRFQQVIAVEYDSGLTQEARKASDLKKHFQFYTAKVEDFVSEIVLKTQSTFLVDPPRGGCEEPVMRALAHADPDQIIYVSCHPASLARDLERFFRVAPTGAYKLKRVVCFDMFPQTDHIETVAEIGRA